jgi:hypothetical protein
MIGILTLAGVLLPAFIALKRYHRHRVPITVINVIMLFMMFAVVALQPDRHSAEAASSLGSTIILCFPFWVATLVWSVWPQSQSNSHNAD